MKSILLVGLLLCLTVSWASAEKEKAAALETEKENEDAVEVNEKELAEHLAETQDGEEEATPTAKVR